MAPEQLTGGEVDRRTDVFAAAVVLWEALTGERLFRGETPGALVHAVLSSEIAPPSSLAPDLPRAVDDVVMRGLARQKRERYATAREMAAALEAALPPATARAVGEWTEGRAATSLEKRAWLVKDVESASATEAGELPMPTQADAMSGHDEMPSGALRERRPACGPRGRATAGVEGLAAGVAPRRGHGERRRDNGRRRHDARRPDRQAPPVRLRFAAAA